MNLIISNYKTYFSLLVFFLLISSLFSQADSSFQFQTSSNLEIKPGGSAEIAVDVFIPEGKHSYVDKASVLSVNIPTEFTVKTKGFAAVIKEMPATETKGTDHILKGKGSEKAGTYILTIFENTGKASGQKPINVVLEINTQWCVTDKDICTPPKKINKNLAIKVVGEKKISMKLKAGNGAKGGIQWITSLDSAKSKALSSGQNIFVVITAPEWCGYCKVLERDVFSKDKVIKTLNSNVVSLEILDTNPDLDKFNIDGFPHMLILDSKGKTLVNNFDGRDERTFLAGIKKYEVTSGSENNSSDTEIPENKEESTEFKYRIEGKTGTFAKGIDGSWSQTTKGITTKLVENNRDENYIILRNKKTKKVYAIPLNSKSAFYRKNNTWEPFELE